MARSGTCAATLLLSVLILILPGNADGSGSKVAQILLSVGESAVASPGKMLGEMGVVDKEAMEALRQASRGEDHSVKAAALAVLVMIGESNYREVQDVLDGASPQVLDRFFELLKREGKSAVPFLGGLVRGRKVAPAIEDRALGALGAMADREGAAFLVRHLESNPRGFYSGYAAKAVLLAGGKAVLPLLDLLDLPGPAGTGAGMVISLMSQERVVETCRAIMADKNLGTASRLKGAALAADITGGGPIREEIAALARDLGDGAPPWLAAGIPPGKYRPYVGYRYRSRPAKAGDEGLYFIPVRNLASMFVYLRSVQGALAENIALFLTGITLVDPELDFLKDSGAALFDCAKNDNTLTREAAAAFLPYTDNPKMVPVLVGLMGDGSWEVKTAAARSLGEICSVEAAEELQRRSAWPSERDDFKSLVREALAKIEKSCPGLPKLGRGAVPAAAPKPFPVVSAGLKRGAGGAPTPPTSRPADTREPAAGNQPSPEPGEKRAYDEDEVRAMVSRYPNISDVEKGILEKGIKTGDAQLLGYINEYAYGKNISLRVGADELLAAFGDEDVVRDLVKIAARTPGIPERVVLRKPAWKDRFSDLTMKVIFYDLSQLSRRDYAYYIEKRDACVKAIEALGRLGDKDAVIPLAKIWRQDEEYPVLKAVALSLVSIDEPEAVALLSVKHNWFTTIHLSAAADGLSRVSYALVRDCVLTLLEHWDIHFRMIGLDIVNNLAKSGRIDPKNRDDELEKILIQTLCEDESYPSMLAGEIVLGLGWGEEVAKEALGSGSGLILRVYPYLIMRGRKGSEQILIRALKESGTTELYSIFALSGNVDLMAAAEQWKKEHQARIRFEQLRIPVGYVKWGVPRVQWDQRNPREVYEY